MRRTLRPSRMTNEDDVSPDMNTTPLIDVMLVLLVMLIITIPIQLHAVNLNLPNGTPPPKLVEPETIKINIDATSQIYWQGMHITERDQLENLMRSEASKAIQPELHLRPHPNAKYAVVAAVMASVQRLGLTKLGVVGSEQFSE
jgi:biopolymer transport protein ExbD